MYVNALENYKGYNAGILRDERIFFLNVLKVNPAATQFLYDYVVQ